VTHGRSRRLAYIAWAAVCIVWGTTYLGIRIALESIPPGLVGGLRYTIAGSVVMGWLCARGERLPPLGLWPRLALVGFLLIVIGNGFVIWAEQWVPSGMAFTGRSMTAEAYLIVFGSLIGYSAYVYALEHLPVSTVSLYAYVNPVIAVVLGALIVREPFGPRVIVASLMVLAGIATVRWRSRRVIRPSGR
jgi:drug/metabolite transporter (DMT)-like permease